VATGKGLGNVSKMDRGIWAEFGSHPDKVKQLAALIRSGAEFVESMQEAPSNEGDEFVEGRILTELHKKRERNPNVRKRILAARRKKGKLTCDICKTQSRSSDPTLEDATLEAHHLMPISMALERKTQLADIALLCANCHRLLHRAISIKKRWLDINEGRQTIDLLDEYGENSVPT